MKIIKYILGGLLILSGLGFMFNGSFLGGFLIALAGLAVLPPVAEKNKEKYPFWRKAIIRRSALIFIALVGFGIAGVQTDGNSLNNEPSEVSKNTSKLLYSDYQQKVKSKVESLSEKDKAKRSEFLDSLKANPLYKTLVIDKVTSAEYIPVVNAIANGISYIHNGDGFLLSEDVAKQMEEADGSEVKISFAVKSIALAQPHKGGLPNELINVFERYKDKYKYYGEPSTRYGINKEQVEKIKYNYDFTPIFGVLSPENETVLDAIYEARKKGLSNWHKEGDYDYTFDYTSTLKGYNNHVKNVYPESPYVINADIEVSAVRLFRDYEANEIAADEKYKGKTLAVTGTIGDIGNDVFNDPYVSLNIDILQNVNCYFDDDNKKVISKLRKGQKVTIIGVCGGKSLNIMVSLRDCKLWE